MSLYNILADDFKPPMLSTSSDSKVRNASVTTSAAEVSLGGVSGMYYVTMQAITADVYVAFKPATNASATVTTSTGWKIPAGTSVNFVVSSDLHGAFEHIGSTSGSIQWYISSTKRNLSFR